MGTSTLKSTAITNLDAIPGQAPTTGEGGPGYLKEVTGYVTTVAADDTSSVYQIVRVPTVAKIKDVLFESADTGGTGTVDVGVRYSTSTKDGTPAAVQGTAVNDAFFASAIDVSGAAVAITNVTNQSGSYTLDKRNEPLWQAAGLSADPGGFFDICITPAAALTNAGVMGLSVRYVL